MDNTLAYPCVGCQHEKKFFSIDLRTTSYKKFMIANVLFDLCKWVDMFDWLID
jgi:hypothetical protein